jgi:protein arginine kinase
MPPPAWLAPDAPHGDVVLSSRCRVMRNLVGHKFPHRAERQELEEILKSILTAVKEAGLELEAMRGLSPVERDHLVACRLISHNFEVNEPGRAILIDHDRSISLMVNEEDHLRLQGLTAGWSIGAAESLTSSVLKNLEKNLAFAHSPKYGFLAASPYNAGQGRRLSSMFHLIGLAQSKRLPGVLRALAQQGLAARGLFGEASRAVGAFVQVSVTTGSVVEFMGACEYLMKEERDARNSLGRDALEEKAKQALEFAVVSPTITLADALRVLAWARWAASAGLSGFDFSSRDVDTLLTTLEIKPGATEPKAAQRRASFLRQALGA